MNKNDGSASGIGFVGLLTILFIALKLTNIIDWSWWWVLSPIWLVTVSIIITFIIIIVILGK